MLQGLNKALEMSFSWKGLRWRFEALRTGRSFAEVVLLHTLVYRVEQIFLIHAESGLLLRHVTEKGLEYQDADLVSGMLTAVQDFVRDCFAGGSQDSLDTMQMGERTLMMEKGSQLVLACVVRGTPPGSFRRTLRETLDIIQLETADVLENFQGETSQFLPITHHLEDCLIARYVDEKKKLPLLVRALPALLLLAVFAGLGYLWWEERRFDRAVAILRNEPGLVVTETGGSYLRGWELVLLRDPMARNPADVMAEMQIRPEQYSMLITPFTSLQTDMVAARLAKFLELPDTVRMRFEDGTVFLEGQASLAWILISAEKALAFPGVERVDTKQLIDPRTARLRELITAVEKTRVEFPLGKDQPAPEERAKLAGAVESLAELASLANRMGLAATLFIYGHADPTGSDKRNYELSVARATTLASMLYAKGVAMPITTYGFGSDYLAGTEDDNPETVHQNSRRIELKVHLNFLGKSLMDF
jgi:OOP family OmpA-OmpF porin